MIPTHRVLPTLATLMICLAMTVPPLAQAVPIAINTQAGTGAGRLIGVPPIVEVNDAGPATASAIDSGTDGTDSTSAQSESTVLGALRAKASADAPSDTFQIVSGTSYATWNVTLTTDGVDPGAPVDLDLSFDFTGSMTTEQLGLDVLNLGAQSDIIFLVAVSPSFDDSIAAIQAGLPPSGAIVFDGGLTLTASNAVDAPTFDIGDNLEPAVVDWTDSPATDFVIDPTCSATSCTVTIDSTVSLANVSTFGFGTTIDVWAYLGVSGTTITTNDAFAGVNIFDTVNIDVGTSTNGVTIVPAAAAAVPAPATAGLLAAGGLVLISLRRRARV